MGRTANILDSGHLEVQNCNRNKGADEGRDHLNPESDLRRNVSIMGKFQVLRKGERMRSGDVAVRLEEIHGGGIAWEPETTEKLGKHVQSNLRVRDRTDDTNRYAKYESQEDTVQHDCRCGVRGICAHTGCTERNRHDENAGGRNASSILMS